MFFDTHAHYDDDRYKEDLDELLKNAYDSGVHHILSASTDVESSRNTIALANRYDFLYAAVGIHPHNAPHPADAELDDEIISALSELSKDKKVIAVGEMGLDYYYDNAPRDAQKRWFAKQIALAKELDLPIIVHDREAHKDTLDILKAESASKVGGVLHCFSGSVEFARQVLNEGFYISIAGPVTFKNTKRLPEVVKYLPEDRLLIETDAPYLSPEPFRGKRNDSSRLVHIAKVIAEIRGVSLEHIAELTTRNAKELFKM
jgi:TatD DNase family protein